MIFSKSDWKTFDRGTEKEWLLTNGLGSFASSTIIGANTRRYHGLLISSLKYPVNKVLTISKYDEVIEINGEEFSLSTNQVFNHIQDGYKYLQQVKVEEIVTYLYKMKDVLIEKNISMVYGKNTIVVTYTIKNGLDFTKFKISPFVNFRDFHGISGKEDINFNKISHKDKVILNPKNTNINIEIKSDKGEFKDYEDIWFYNMEYNVEKRRGLSYVEDHYMPGYFEVFLNPNERKEITILGTIGSMEKLNGNNLINKEQKRVSALIEKANYKDEFINKLVMAADKFIVKRESTGAKSIIAGYPWFSDWGRDAMISLPGLTLVTKRFEDAKEILLSFSKYIKKGLIPNVLPEVNQRPIYNTVDASLWMFEAIYKFSQYTNDYKFIKENIYPTLKQIIEYYKQGTDYNIKMNSDGLISCGDYTIQLTWMDAKVGDWIVTPRHGKAVEINALWYNALKIMNYFAVEYEDNNKTYEQLAHKVKESFQKFWNQDMECLYDLIDENFKDDKIRPNQIFSISLSYPVIEGKQAQKVVNKVFKELYYTFGLRSLSSKHKEYIGTYIGDQYARDSAYHQGTIWAWLIGPFITAYRKANNYSEESKKVCEKFIEPFKVHLRDAGLGSISEIFDADDPLLPRGCIAQAWSVAEVLRTYVEDIYDNKV